MPRSVGTERPIVLEEQAARHERRRVLVFDPRRRHTFEDAQSEEHLFEVGVARFEQFVAADREPSRLDPGCS